MMKKFILILFVICGLWVIANPSGNIRDSIDSYVTVFYPYNNYDDAYVVQVFDDKGLFEPLNNTISTYSSVVTNVKGFTNIISNFLDWFYGFINALSNNRIVSFFRAPIRELIELIFEEGADLFPWGD